METLQGYVEQMTVTLRPNSMPHIEREFALWLRDQEPEVEAVRDLRRGHIERYKRRVAQKPESAWRAAVQALGRWRVLNPC